MEYHAAILKFSILCLLGNKKDLVLDFKNQAEDHDE